MSLFYLSFSAADGWRGACYIRASSWLEAVTISHKRGCNPGGEVMAFEMPPRLELDDRWIGRLLTKEDLCAIDREFGGDGDVRIVKTDAPVCSDCNEEIGGEDAN